MIGTSLEPGVYFQSLSGTSTKPSGTLSKKSSLLSTFTPFTPIWASTLYSVEVNLPTFFTNFCSLTSSISAPEKVFERPLIVFPIPIFLLMMR